jgi:organic hydroperoxide reductase OsmC/OhrA
VTAYSDETEGVMEERPDDSGRFTQATLRPRVTVTAGTDTERAYALHHAAHEKWFIANSVNFPVACERTILTAEQVANSKASA